MVIGDIMKKALCDTTTSVQYISSWSGNTPVYETYPNSARVCEVADAEFPVYQTLIWVDCADDVVADQYYYDTEAQTINPVENAPQPEPTQE
jgi:inosine-uridine nucleoside N-ribohydrolase